MLELLGLLLVLDHKGVEEPGASDLELGAVSVLLDLYTLGVFPASLHQEVLQKSMKQFRIDAIIEIKDGSETQVKI